jgi:hypothetical protein
MKTCNPKISPKIKRGKNSYSGEALRLGKEKCVGVIFLDIDGVLNCQSSKTRCCGVVGIDNGKVKILREIVKRNKAVIVLTSSWKTCWERTEKDIQHEMGNYLDRKLKREQLWVLDKTDDDGWNRGEGIRKWLQCHPNVTDWIVLDDEVFKDYEKFGIMEHLIKTSFYDDNGGLQEEHIEKACKLFERRTL